MGDTKVPFCLQSCVKPLKYAIAVHDHGTDYVHRFIGKEPSGLRFNKLFLNEEGEDPTAPFPWKPAGASAAKDVCLAFSFDTSKLSKCRYKT